MMLQELFIEKTQSTPSVHFSAQSNLLRVAGESFPENSAKFYSPVIGWLREYLPALGAQPAIAEFEIIYFNSSTSKVFLTIFEMLEEAVKNGKDITVNWICDEKNETAIECGDEFKEDLTELPFHIVISQG
jgi:hypothetical protein